MRRRVFVSNVFGNKNKGDQVLFESLRDAVRAQGGEICWAIATNPADNARIYPDIEWFGVPWYTPRQGTLTKAVHAVTALLGLLPGLRRLAPGNAPLLEALEQADVVVACPGGYLEDSSYSYISHILQLGLAAILGRELILAPQSIGPVDSRFWRIVLRAILRRAGRVYVRERWSYDFCVEELELPDDHVSLIPDLAVYVPFAFAGHRFAVRARPSSPCLGITVLNWGFGGREDLRRRYRDRIIDLARRFHDRGWAVRLLPQTFSADAPNADLEFAAAILETSPFIESIDQPEHLEEFMGQFAGITVTVGSRLHSALLSIVAGVPAVALAYLPKSTGTFDLLDIEEYVHDMGDFSVDEVEEQVRWLADDTAAGSYFHRINSALESRSVSFRI